MGNEKNITVGAKGGAIAFSLKILSTALGFINQIILARILGAGGVGEVILAVTVVRIAVQIAKFGMEESMMKFIPLYLDKGDNSRLKGAIFFAVKFSLLFSIVFMFFVLVFSRYLSLEIFHSEGLLKLMPVVVIAIPAWVVRDVIGGILRGYKDVLTALIPESLVSPLIRIVIFLILIINGISPLYAIIAFVLGEVMAAITSIRFLLKKIRVLRPVKPEYERKRILDVAHTVIFTSMSVLLYTQADIWILGMFKTTETIGIYGVASKLVLLVYFPMMALTAIVPSIISSVHASNNINELRRVVQESTRWILSMAMPAILVLLLEGRLILSYVYGLEFAAGYIPLIILVSGQMIKAFAGLIGVILQMTGEHKIYMKISIIWGGINIIMNLILVPRYGMIGAAISTAFALSMVDIICIFVIYKRLAITTIARGVKFDLFFIVSVVACYLLLSYNNLYSGLHILLFVSLTVYIWKSVVCHDIPWKLLTTK